MVFPGTEIWSASIRLALPLIGRLSDDVPDLVDARDFAIDGRIHVLMEDGRTLTFSRGALIGTVSPFVVPALTDAAFLADVPFANDFYIVDPAGIGENVGRIVRVDASGEARQYFTPAPAPGDLTAHAAAVTLATVEDLAIDELTGIVYWVSEGVIWRATPGLVVLAQNRYRECS